jgi:hypothetical protein
MVTLVEESTGVVDTLKIAVEFPAGTVTVAGTVADELLLETPTEIPPLGAGLLNVMVPMDGLPPATVTGFTDTHVKAAAGLTVSWAVFMAPL